MSDVTMRYLPLPSGAIGGYLNELGKTGGRLCTILVQDGDHWLALTVRKPDGYPCAWLLGKSLDASKRRIRTGGNLGFVPSGEKLLEWRDHFKMLGLK